MLMKYTGSAPVNIVGVVGAVNPGDVVEVPNHRAEGLPGAFWEKAGEAPAGGSDAPESASPPPQPEPKPVKKAKAKKGSAK